MRMKAGALVAMVVTACCVVQVTTDGGTPANAAPKQPAAPRSPAFGPGGIRRMTTPTAPVQTSAVSPAKLAAMTPTSINIVRVQQIAKRNPKNCGYVEVSPKNWVHIDCGKYSASKVAVPHLSLRKARFVKKRLHLFRPLRLHVRPSMLKGSGSVTHPKGGAVGAEGAPGASGPAQVGDTFPDTVDHRADNLEGAVKNQGGVGSCTGHSLSTALDNAAIRGGFLKPGDRDRMASPMHVWSRYGMPNMGAAADTNVAQPIGLYSVWPQNDKEACKLFQGEGAFAADCSEAYDVKAGSWRDDKLLMGKYDKSQSEGLYKISSIERLETEPANMEELLGILAGGADVWAAFAIDGSKWRNSAMTNAVIPDWNDPASGHAVVVSGYRQTPKGRQFLIHNSWGTSWGDGGYAWVSEKMVNKYMYYAYKVKITNGVPKEDLTDDDCAPDELVDLTTGLCAVMCNDDTRPNNGCK